MGKLIMGKLLSILSFIAVGVATFLSVLLLGKKAGKEQERAGNAESALKKSQEIKQKKESAKQEIENLNDDDFYERVKKDENNRDN